MDRAANDDAASFARWVEPHIPAMARLATRLGSEADRDDIVQEALSRAWQKWHLYDASRGTPSVWLMAITADQVRKHRRRWLRWHPGREADPVVSDFDPDLDRALATLAPRQRMAVDCYYFVGLSVSETAAVMRCSEGTIKSTLSDARARLRVQLEVRP